MPKKTRSEDSDICELVRKMEKDYISGKTVHSKYVAFSQYETVEKIDAYLNSKHISGDTDSLGREKPFFNIGTSIRNIWYRATDIDRNRIRPKATKSEDRVAAFVAYMHLQEWMRKMGFGAFLNDWGRSLATYGSSVLKFIEKNGELIPQVIPWNRLISDTVDFENNPKIEVLWLTPSQLKKNKSYNKDMVEELLSALETRETLDGQQKDNKSDYIKLYEVHGELPLSYITGKKKDDDVYVQQMHVVSFVAKNDSDYDDFSLYKGQESKDPYMITHLIKEDGRAMGIGAIEHLFEAQWMVNHSQKQIKDQLDLASKIITQTADSTFIGQNVLTAIETGDILIHAANAPLTRIDTRADITALQNFGRQWEVLAKEITSTPDALRGETQPSGTAWRQVEALRVESHSLFELMTENKGLHINEMMTKFVLPHIKKQFDTTDELAATLSSAGVIEFDSIYVPDKAIQVDNEQIKQTVLSGEVAYNLDRSVVEQEIKKGLASNGNQRFIKPSDLDNKTWKEYLKNFEWEMGIDPTNEEKDNDSVMTTLTTVLKTIATNPAVLSDPNMKLLFNRILEETGAISPLELSHIPTPQPTVGGSNVETAKQPMEELVNANSK
jgi:hypothetical protein